jgi:hypothetical protein
MRNGSFKFPHGKITAAGHNGTVYERIKNKKINYRKKGKKE